MKKIEEDNKAAEDVFFDKEMPAHLDEAGIIEKEKVENLFNSLSGCDKDMKFYDKGNWYISFD